MPQDDDIDLQTSNSAFFYDDIARHRYMVDEEPEQSDEVSEEELENAVRELEDTSWMD